MAEQEALRIRRLREELEVENAVKAYYGPGGPMAAHNGCARDIAAHRRIREIEALLAEAAEAPEIGDLA